MLQYMPSLNVRSKNFYSNVIAISLEITHDYIHTTLAIVPSVLIYWTKVPFSVPYSGFLLRGF